MESRERSLMNVSSPVPSRNVWFPDKTNGNTSLCTLRQCVRSLNNQMTISVYCHFLCCLTIASRFLDNARCVIILLHHCIKFLKKEVKKQQRRQKDCVSQWTEGCSQNLLHDCFCTEDDVACGLDTYLICLCGS